MEYQAKSPVLYCVSKFEGTSYKKLQDIATSSFISFCFTLAYTSADTIFHKLFKTLFKII